MPYRTPAPGLDADEVKRRERERRGNSNGGLFSAIAETILRFKCDTAELRSRFDRCDGTGTSVDGEHH